MNQRTQFIADHLRETQTITELCDRYGVSRKTGYKWIDRYLRLGPAGLEERSRRPHRAPNQTADEIVAAILEARHRHPVWGGKKLRALLQRRHPRWTLPGRSTVCDILSRHGLVPTRRQRRRLGHPGKPTTIMGAPNAVWCADYKGQFKTGDGRYCYPLTVTDGFSRYLLGCQGLGSTAGAEAQPVFTRLFKEYGLPLRIRTDNGVPFATTTLARLSKLSAWWVRLGILPEFIEPGRPDQNGRHERMHRTLKAATTRPAAGSLGAQQRRFNTFREEFNHVRPHEALEQQTPATCYHPSPRAMPDRLPPLEYPDRFEVRYVSANSSIRWNRRWVNVSTVCVGEYVGLEEIEPVTAPLFPRLQSFAASLDVRRTIVDRARVLRPSGQRQPPSALPAALIDKASSSKPTPTQSRVRPTVSGGAALGTLERILREQAQNRPTPRVGSGVILGLRRRSPRRPAGILGHRSSAVH